MRELFGAIDRVLRGGFLARREARKLERLRVLALGGFLLGAVYGVFMGLYGALRPVSPSVLQLLATTLKVPLLFLLTLVVTFPSLYVLGALSGLPLRFRETLGVLLAAVLVTVSLLASLGPVTGFFTLSTESYPFMVVLNVLFFAASGLGGLIFLRRALEAAIREGSLAWEDVGGDAAKPPAPPEPESPAEHPAAERRGGVPLAPVTRTRLLFTFWIIIYGAVGAQMGWILRPFIGYPGAPFQLFRERRSNFFEALFDALEQLFR